MQRRHQKLIEETPSPGLDEEPRGRLGKAAVAVAAPRIRNAGTVEFLMDRSGNFYFLEMNTRLQVEHTVTEMVTGIDLVKEQLRIAQGEPLSFDRVKPAGMPSSSGSTPRTPPGISCRIPGRVVEYREPGGFGVRVDSGIRPGAKVSQYYDNLMAKLVVWGPTGRSHQSGTRALGEFHIRGVATTIPAHLRVLHIRSSSAAAPHPVGGRRDGPLRISLPTAPTLPEDEEREREITVEVGGRRYGSDPGCRNFDQPAGPQARAAPAPEARQAHRRGPAKPASSPPRCRERSSRCTRRPVIGRSR